jgi:polyhydroxybutyrate depolymerase
MGRDSKRFVLTLVGACGLLGGCSNTATELGSTTGGQLSSSGSGNTNPACAAAPLPVTQSLQEIVVGSMQRQYRLSVPEVAAATPLPIVMAFHGGGGRDEPFPQQQLLDSLVQSRKVIVVYPLGELMPPNEGEWLLNTSDGRRQDIDLVDAILDDLSSRYCVDEKRVYATGYSLGAMFNYDLACQLSQRFSAVVPVAGSMPQSMDSCPMVDNVSILHIHGRDDPIVPYSDGWNWKAWPAVGPMRSVPSLVEYWRTRYNCEEFDDASLGDVRHVIYGGCDGDVRVEHYGLGGAGHGWPDSIGNLPTAKVIWDFMRGFKKP